MKSNRTISTSKLRSPAMPVRSTSNPFHSHHTKLAVGHPKEQVNVHAQAKIPVDRKPGSELNPSPSLEKDQHHRLQVVERVRIGGDGWQHSLRPVPFDVAKDVCIGKVLGSARIGWNLRQIAMATWFHTHSRLCAHLLRNSSRRRLAFHHFLYNSDIIQLRQAGERRNRRAQLEAEGRERIISCRLVSKDLASPVIESERSLFFV